METKTETKPEAKLTHWKKMTNPNYIGAHDFQPNQEITITIESVGQEIVKNSEGKDEQCIVCKIVKSKKPMILNKTNCKILAKLFSTPYVEEWAGKSAILYVAKIKAFGEVMDAIRVKNQKI